MIGQRFELIRRLGQGGMGEVYLAFDRLERREVALKRWLLAGDLAAADSEGSNEMLRIAHEFRLLAGLRHPNIISVYDFGFDEGGQPFFTMEALEEPISLLEEPAVAERAGHWLEVLSALTYLHRHGVVHRDLKPANILIAQGRVRLLDFGISELDSALRTRRSVESPSLIGTLAYLAPELLNGEAAGPASDLWAFGVVLYEALTGRQPFTGTVAQILRKILLEKPELNEKIPLPLWPIFTRLLAKDPAERYQRADLLARDLCAAFGVAPPAEAETVRDGYLQKAPLIGREQEQRQIVAHLEGALAGRGGLVLVSGESGVGKSRLFAEIRVLAQVRGFLVVAGHADAAGGAAFAVWRRILIQIALLVAPSAEEAASLRTAVPDLDLYLGRPLPAMPALDPQGQQDLLLATVLELLRRATVPLLWVLDDLQWADGPSRALLGGLLPRLSELRLLVLAGTRGETLDVEPGAPGKTVEQLRLARLDAGQVADFAGSVLGGRPRPQLLEHLVRETEGNPFFLVEILRAMAESAGRLDEVGKSAPGEGESLRIREALELRLALVPEPARELLEIAALAGRRLDLAWLAEVAPATDLEAWLRAAAPVLEADGLTWQFGHDRLREALVERQDASVRRQRHARLAAALEKVEAPNRVAALAHHWRAAAADGDSASLLRAIEALERQGSLLLNLAAPEAFESLEQALGLLARLPADRERLALEARLLGRLAAALFERRQLAESAVPCQRMLAIGRELGDPGIQLAGYFGGWRRHFYAANLRRAREIAVEFRQHADAGADEPSRLMAAVALGITSYFQGFAEEATETLQPALDRFEKSPEALRGRLADVSHSFHPVVTAAITASYAWSKRGRTPAAMAGAGLVQRIAFAGDHALTRCVGWLFLAAMRYQRSEPAPIGEIYRQFRREEKLAPEYWQNVVGAVALWSEIRQTGEGLAELRQIFAWLKQFGLLVSLPYYGTLMADGELLAGDLAEAEILIEQMLARVDQQGTDVYRPELLRLRAMTLERRGRIDEAIATCEQALAATATWQEAVVAQRAAWHLWQLRPDAESRRRLAEATAQLDTGFDFPEATAARRELASGD